MDLQQVLKDKMQIFKKNVQHLMLGFDLKSNVIKIMSVSKTDVLSAQVSYYPCPNDLNNAEELFEALNGAIKSYLQDHQVEASGLTVILPDKFVGIDYISIPALNKSSMAGALRVKINELYKNNDELIFNDLAITVTKKFSTYIISMIRKDVLSAVMKATSANKIGTKAVTFSANSMSNAVINLRPKLKHNNYAFVDVKEDLTIISMIGKGKTLGYTTLPFGYRILKDDRVINEQLLFDHDVAHLAVINAKEYAKMKKIKTFMLEDEEEQTEEGATASTATEIDAFGNEVSVAKKHLKKLPKSMQRAKPTDKEGFILENFRPILKRILLYKQFNEQNEQLPKLEFALINIPSEFSFIIDRLNLEQEEHKIEFKYFDVDSEGNTSLNDNLELFGGVYVKNTNKNHNF